MLDVFQAQAGKGKLLVSGLNLLSTNVESVYLLDQFIKYARSRKFQSAGAIDAERLRLTWQALTWPIGTLNGCQVILSASEQRPYTSFLGQLPLYLARQTDGRSHIRWKTAPVPVNVRADEHFNFKWAAGMGFANEPAGKFTLFLGKQALVDFNVTLHDATWRGMSGKVLLEYTAKKENGVDSSGLMNLTMPASLLSPGKPVILRVVGSATASQRWFGIYQVRQ